MTDHALDSGFDTARERREGRAAAALALGFLVFVTALAAIALDRERRLLLHQAREQSALLAALFEENTARTFDGVDNALVGVAAYVGAMRPQAHDQATRETMRARLQFMPTVRAIFVIGPDGYIIHDTDYPNTPNVSLADRAYFRKYLQNDDLQRDLSEALRSRSGTGWFVASTRRISAPDGQFVGVAVAAVQLDSISRLYRQLGLQPGQQVSLLQSDGTLLARHPHDNEAVGRSYASFPVFSQMLHAQHSGTFDSSGPPWNYDRVVSYRKLQSQPMVVVVTNSKDAALAGWKRAAAGAVVALFVLALLTAGLVLFFAQRQRARSRALQHRKAADAALEIAHANAKFRAFFEQGSLFGCVVDPQGSIVELNSPGGARDIPACRFWECDWWSKPATQPSQLREGFELAAHGGTWRGETAFEDAEGRMRLMELVLSPIRDPGGGVHAVAAVGVDVTERKSQEEQLRVVARDLSEVDRRRGEFLATLSHELRNVLTPVQNCAQIMKLVDPASDQALRAREMLSEQLVQMRRLVDDLLDISRVDSGKVELALAPVDLREVLTTAAAAAHTSMDRAGHRFEMRLPDEELPVEGDAARLQQVFVNLLGNAAKYTPAGGHVRLLARREGFECVVEVVDDGVGIPAEAQETVFEMFEQVGSHESWREGGLGIGLALVRKLTAMHGGHVESFSRGTGMGSTFTVYLPVAGSRTAASGATPHAKLAGN